MRKGLAIVAFAWLLPVASAEAGGQPSFVLPVLATASLSGPMASWRLAPRARAAFSGGLLGDLPLVLALPRRAVTDLLLARPLFLAPLQQSRRVGVGLGRASVPWMLSVAYAEESRRMTPGTSELLRLIAEFRF